MLWTVQGVTAQKKEERLRICRSISLNLGGNNSKRNKTKKCFTVMVLLFDNEPYKHKKGESFWPSPLYIISVNCISCLVRLAGYPQLYKPYCLVNHGFPG